MGARNAVAAYQRWAGRVPATSMQVLVYMALVAKDADDWPWYGQGQHAIAEMGMGRANPGAADLRAVSRAMQPLLDAGAVTCERAATQRGDGNSTARYRLNLHDAADNERQKWEASPAGQRRLNDPRRRPGTHDGNRRMTPPPDGASHTTVSDRAIRRKVASHTTVCGEPYDGNRRTKEKEITQEERENQGKSPDLRPPLTLARDTAPAAETPPEPPPTVIEIFPGAAQEARYQPRPAWTTRAAEAIAQATANRERARQRTAGETHPPP